MTTLLICLALTILAIELFVKPIKAFIWGVAIGSWVIRFCGIPGRVVLGLFHGIKMGGDAMAARFEDKKS